MLGQKHLKHGASLMTERTRWSFAAKEREIERLAATFSEAAHQHHADKAEGFRNKKHRDQWINTLEKFICPKNGKKRVNELAPADFATCLKPIWLEKPEIASRVKQRCDTVMNWATANGYIMASPVGVGDKLLAKQPSKRERVQHQPALPWRSAPSFFAGIQRHHRRQLSLA